MISFPTSSTATTGRTVSSSTTATASHTTTATSSSSTSSNSNYAYLSTVSSLLLNSASPTTSLTLSNPSQPPTSVSLLSAAPTASPSAPALPAGLPEAILPSPPLNLTAVPSNFTMINLLFNMSLSWEFVASHADSQGQIFEYTPEIISTALGVGGMFVI